MKHASVARCETSGTAAACATWKAALEMLTRNLDHELAKDKVRVDAVAPGTIVAPLTERTRSDPESRAKFLARIPLRRFGDPDEVARPVVFLASEMASYITGAILPIDGGMLTV